jgi:hypothetical protein
MYKQHNDPSVSLRVVRVVADKGRKIWTVERKYEGRVTSHSGDFQTRREAELHLMQWVDGSIFNEPENVKVAA